MSTPAPTPRRPRATKASALPSKSTTGATAKGASVAEVICPAAPRRNNTVATAHQTHGAVTPLTGAISNANQLINGGRSIAKGSSASFTSLGEYGAYLRTLDLHTLRNHALQDARIVPIDDRDRLIRRLETQWTTVAARTPGLGAHIPQRAPFTQEQIDAQAAIKNKLLRVS